MEDRFNLARDQFLQALAAFERVLAQPEDEFIRDSIIKRFELCFETARKAMQRWLQQQQELTDHSTKRDVMTAALRTGLVTDADTWNALGVARNDTSHEYDQAKALAYVALARTDGLAAFRALAETLKHR